MTLGQTRLHSGFQFEHRGRLLRGRRSFEHGLSLRGDRECGVLGVSCIRSLCGRGEVVTELLDKRGCRRWQPHCDAIALQEPRSFLPGEQLGAIIGIVLCPEYGEVAGFQIQGQAGEDADLHLAPVHLLAPMPGPEYEGVPSLTGKRQIQVSCGHPPRTMVLVGDDVRKGYPQGRILRSRLEAQCTRQTKQQCTRPPKGSAQQWQVVIVTPRLNRLTILAQECEPSPFSHYPVNPLDLCRLWLRCTDNIEYIGQSGHEMFRFLPLPCLG